MDEHNEVWICGQVLSRNDATRWEFQGVFSTEELAIQACKTKNYFIGPAIIDQELPSSLVSWPGAYYPLLEKE